jgi:mannose-1-phosphate guanylyltransferase
MQRVNVIMAGGSGERFWPLSRRGKPKQLLRLTHHSASMLEEAVARMAPLIPSKHIFIVTGQHLVAPIRDAAVGVPPENVLGEPAKRNTSGALAYAAAMLLARYGGDGSDLTMAVTTADHRIGDVERFRKTISAAMSSAERDAVLVTLGIVPTRPETGYGYIQVAGEAKTGKRDVPVLPVRSFHEKPSQERAEDFIASGRYYWNSGMFFWRVSTFLSELDRAYPALSDAIRKMAAAIKSGKPKQTLAVFEKLEDISIDFALMERARRVAMARADFPWDDVGAWTALDRAYPKDSAGNVAVGDPVLIDAEDCIVYNAAGPAAVAVSVIGVEDLIVVITNDAALIVSKSRAQDVRHAVQELKRRRASQL